MNWLLKKQNFGFRNLSTSKKLIYGIALGLCIAIGYFMVNDFISKKNQFPNSIAVLPFKDFSPVDDQSFSDGISYNILN